MSEKQENQSSKETNSVEVEGVFDGVEPETGRPRSSSVIGGRRSPQETAASERAGVLKPEKPVDNEDRTGKKLSQWGAGSRRRSYWRERYY